MNPYFDARANEFVSCSMPVTMSAGALPLCTHGRIKDNACQDADVTPDAVSKLARQ